MSVRKVVFAVFAIVLLFAGAVYAFPRDMNPSAIDSVRFPGNWETQMGSMNVDSLRVFQFLIEEFNTTGAGPGGSRDLKIWKTPSFNPDKVAEADKAWEHLLNNPGAAVPLTVGRSLITTHDEMIEFIEAFPRTNLLIEYLGEIPKGFPYPFLVFSKESDRSPAGLAASGKPLVWVQGNIHGGEWSGGEGALALAYDLAHGRYDHLLDKVNVVMNPRINADGVKSPLRTTNDLLFLQWTSVPETRDLNRDNMLLDLHVSRVLRKMFLAYGPHFCVDLHERGATSVLAALTDRFGIKFDSDAGDIGPAGSQLLNVPQDLTRLRFEYMEPDLAKFGELYGLTFGLYREGTDTFAHGQSNNYATVWNNWSPQPGEPTAGPYAAAALTNGFITSQAWDPDAPYYLFAEPAYITRTSNNINAMPGVISQLFENKSGVGRGMWERRVATGYVCILSTITTAANRGNELVPKIMAMRKAWVEQGKTVTSDDMIPILLVQEKPTFWNEGKPEIGYAGREVGYTAIDITGLPTNVVSMSIKDGVKRTGRFDATKAMKYVGPGLGLPGTKNSAYVAVSDDSGTRDYQMFKFERTWLGWNMRERIRPYAYVFEGPYANELATRMMLAGIEVKRLAQDVKIDVEGWHYNRTPYLDLSNGGSTGWLNRDVSVYKIPDRVFKKDAYVVYLGQLLVNLIPLFCEPDIPSNVASCLFLPAMSLALGGPSTGNLSPLLVGVEMPVYRYLKEENLPTYDLNHYLPLANRGAVARFFSYHTQENTAAVRAATGEKYINVFDYDFQVHTRTDGLIDGRFDITLPTNKTNKGYLIQKKDGSYEKLTPKPRKTAGWDVATVIIADHARAPFTINLDTTGKPIVGSSDRMLPLALPATDDLIGVRIVEIVASPIESLFKNGQLPANAKETQNGIEYTLIFTEKGVILSNAMLDGWLITDITPKSGKHWKAELVNGEIVVTFRGDAYNETVKVTVTKAGTTETMVLEIKFSGEKEGTGCNTGFVTLFALFALIPVLFRRIK